MVSQKIGSDRKIRRLEAGQRWAFIAGVLALAAQSPERGRLLIAEGIAVTDADVAEEAGVSVPVARAALKKLRELGVVTRDDDGFELVTSWPTWQPDPKPSDSREAWRERKRLERGRKRAAGQTELAVDEPVSDEVGRLCVLLASLVRERDPKTRAKPEARSWRTACEGLIDAGRSPGEIEKAIRFAMGDDFECAQNLTFPKLARNFDRIVVKMKASPIRAVYENDPGEPCPNGSTPADAIARWDAALPELRAAVPVEVFDLWLAPLHAHRLDGEELVLGSPAGQTARVRERFAEVLGRTLGTFSVVTCGGHA
jgi:hypothetical protein